MRNYVWVSTCDMNKIYQTIVDNNNFYNENDAYECNVFAMEDFNEVVSYYAACPYEICNMVHYGKYCPYDEYFTIDAYGNILTLDNHAIAEWLLSACHDNLDDFIKANLYDDMIDTLIECVDDFENHPLYHDLMFERNEIMKELSWFDDSELFD